MEYLKYLISKKIKLIYCIILLIFLSICLYICVTQVDDLIISVAASILAIIITAIALFQPYVEYRDYKSQNGLFN